MWTSSRLHDRVRKLHHRSSASLIARRQARARAYTVNDDSLPLGGVAGTIAEREHRKWQEATPLANNPYSPENIQRRLEQRASQQPSLLAASDNVTILPASTDTSLQIALRGDPDPKK